MSLRSICIVAISLFAGLGVLASVNAQPQKQKVVRIGVLVPGSPTFFMNRFDAFRAGLRELGYVEGKNLAFEYRYAESKAERLPALAHELVRLKVDLIFSAGAEPILAAKAATKTIPIVFGTVPDPVASGIVDSLARPGGNVTGLSAVAPELGRKRLEILKEIVPGLSRAVYFWSSQDPGAAAGNAQMQSAARSLGVTLQSIDIRDAKDFDKAFDAARKERAQALLTSAEPQVNAQRVRIVDFATENRLPAIYAAPESVEAGGLMTYAPNYGDLWRRAAIYADKILQGAKPADLPVEQPAKFELTINLKAAQQIGLSIPSNVVMRADKIIR